MLNRRQLTDTSIQFEDFATSSVAPFVGQPVEVPMNAFGSVVARYIVSRVQQNGHMIIAIAELVD